MPILRSSLKWRSPIISSFSLRTDHDLNLLNGIIPFRVSKENQGFENQTKNAKFLLVRTQEQSVFYILLPIQPPSQKQKKPHL